MTNWTVEQYEEYLERRRREKLGISKDNDVPLKYHNRKVKVDDHVFDSAREASVYQGLKACEKAGVICDLVLQPRFLLQESFTDFSGKRQKAIYYVADFRFTEKDGKDVVVDVKSKITEANPVYRLKRKLFLYRYRDIEFREIF